MDSVPITARPRRHPLAKVALLLLGILILSLGGACLVPTLIHKFFVSSKRSQLPDEVRRLGGHVTDFTLPHSFEPAESFEVDQFGSTTRVALWRSKTGGFVLLIELPRPFNALEVPNISLEALQFPMLDIPQEGHFLVGPSNRSTETVVVRGEKIDFTIAVPEPGPSGALWGGALQSEITGYFPSKSGARGLLWLKCPSADLKLEELQEFVKSVH